MGALTGKKVGFCVTGSFCTLSKILPVMREFVQIGAEVIPIFSDMVYNTDTRFYKAADFRDRVRAITGREPWHTIVEVEPIGPKRLLDLVLIAPCTGNTMAKLVNGIVDTPVLMAAKAHLRGGGPVVAALATNDALSNNGANFGRLLNLKGMYAVPIGQDDTEAKPTSMVALMHLCAQACEAALDGRQLQPLLRRLDERGDIR